MRSAWLRPQAPGFMAASLAPQKPVRHAAYKGFQLPEAIAFVPQRRCEPEERPRDGAVVKGEAVVISSYEQAIAYVVVSLPWREPQRIERAPGNPEAITLRRRVIDPALSGEDDLRAISACP